MRGNPLPSRHFPKAQPQSWARPFSKMANHPPFPNDLSKLHEFVSSVEEPSADDDAKEVHLRISILDAVG